MIVEKYINEECHSPEKEDWVVWILHPCLRYSAFSSCYRYQLYILSIPWLFPVRPLHCCKQFMMVVPYSQFIIYMHPGVFHLTLLFLVLSVQKHICNWFYHLSYHKTRWNSILVTNSMVYFIPRNEVWYSSQTHLRLKYG